MSPGRHAAPSGQGRGTPAQVRQASPGRLAAETVGLVRDGRAVLDGVDLEVPPGGVLAVVGPSGSGKSSLLTLLAGLEEPDTGRVHRAGGRRHLRQGLVLQGYGLVGVLSAAENVEAPLQAGVLGRLAPEDVRSRSATALADVGLTEVADHLVEELSGGQQQRVAIARALVVEPDVVLADEPTAELDRGWKDRIVGLLLAVAGRGGTVVIATHDPEIATRCDARIRLVDGRVVTGDT